MQIQDTLVGTVPSESKQGAQSWRGLYRLGGLAALLSLLFFPIQIGVFMLHPLPSAVIDWFNLLQAQPLIGLIDLDLLLVVDQVLIMVIFLALFAALKQVNLSWMTVGLTLGLASTILFIASNPAVAMYGLSTQYFAAADDSMRTVILAAGQAVMSGWQGTAFQVSYIAGSVATILISSVMLHSDAFGKAAGILGIIANVVAFGLYVPVIGVYISVFSVLFLWGWYLLMARALLRLAKTT
jgi:hypothetical protein